MCNSLTLLGRLDIRLGIRGTRVLAPSEVGLGGRNKFITARLNVRYVRLLLELLVYLLQMLESASHAARHGVPAHGRGYAWSATSCSISDSARQMRAWSLLLAAY